MEMKIVERDEFLAMPEGTLFSEYEGYSFGPLYIKGETIHHNDFFYQQIVDAVDANHFGEIVEKVENSLKTGEHFGLNFDCESRDGSFEYGQLYAVWSDEDKQKLIERLSRK